MYRIEFGAWASEQMDSSCTEVPVVTVADLSAEFANCQFDDARLTRRAQKLAEVLGRNPNASIPAAFGSKADMEACYRFFDNEKVSPERILEPHFELTYQRIHELDLVLLVQDTTELDLTRPAQQVEGAGPMDNSSRRGAFHHPMLAFDADGVPLGLVGQKSWTREQISEGTKAEKNQKRKATPIERRRRAFAGWKGLAGLSERPPHVRKRPACASAIANRTSTKSSPLPARKRQAIFSCLFAPGRIAGRPTCRIGRIKYARPRRSATRR